MSTNELLTEKQTIVQDALHRKEPKYVPNVINATTGPLAYKGLKAIDLMENTDALAEGMTALFDEMHVDASSILGITVSPKIMQAFDTIENKFGPDGNTIEHVQLAPMKDDEYPELIENPNKLVVEKLLPRKYPTLFTDRENAKKSLKLYAEDRVLTFMHAASAIKQRLLDKYGVDSILNMNERFETPIDIIFDYFRGFRGTLTDLRRRPKEVKEAADILWEIRCLPAMAKSIENPDKFGFECCHIPAYMSVKQFDELFWPHQKQQIMRLVNAGSKAYIVMEGRWEKIWHHFLELPKDSCVLHVDDYDFIKANEVLGEHQILVGGLKSADVRLKSFDQIKDDVKRVIDTCAPGGGFLFTTDKTWISPGDVNETLIEAFNFAHEYSRK